MPAGNGTYHASAGFTPSQAGTYWWVVSAPADANNNAAASACGATKTVVAAGPSISSLVNANHAGGTPGKMEKNDTTTVTFSEPMAVGSFCSAWSNNTTNQSDGTATVTVSSDGVGKDDVLSISAWKDCHSFHFGTMDMGSGGYVTSIGGSNQAVMDFTGSTVAYNVAAQTLTITLGTPQTGVCNGTVGTVAKSVATLTVDPAIRSTSGGPVFPTTFATGNLSQF